jgi:hypothetical protein
MTNSVVHTVMKKMAKFRLPIPFTTKDHRRRAVRVGCLSSRDVRAVFPGCGATRLSRAVCKNDRRYCTAMGRLLFLHSHRILLWGVHCHAPCPTRFEIFTSQNARSITAVYFWQQNKRGDRSLASPFLLLLLVFLVLGGVLVVESRLGHRPMPHVIRHGHICGSRHPSHQ